MKRYTTYLFDFDGTLVDSHDSLVKVFEDSYGHIGVNVPKGYVLRLMRIPLRQGYDELNAPDDQETMDKFEDKIISTLDDPEVLRLTKVYEDTLPSLIRLKSNGARLGIVTSNNVKHVKDVLKFLNIPEKMFSVIIGNGDTEVHKPNPDPILKALERLDISKDGVCYVGDAIDDKRTAINAGVDAVLIDRLDEYDNEPGVVIHSLSEL